MYSLLFNYLLNKQYMLSLSELLKYEKDKRIDDSNQFMIHISAKNFTPFIQQFESSTDIRFTKIMESTMSELMDSLRAITGIICIDEIILIFSSRNIEKKHKLLTCGMKKIAKQVEEKCNRHFSRIINNELANHDTIKNLELFFEAKVIEIHTDKKYEIMNKSLSHLLCAENKNCICLKYMLIDMGGIHFRNLCYFKHEKPLTHQVIHFLLDEKLYSEDMIKNLDIDKIE